MKLFKNALLLGASLAFATSSAMAAFTFTDGDLILGFQATSGTGSSQNVFFNLGSGVNLRDGNTAGILGNISTTLTSVYGADWYEREDLSFGVAGNLSAKPASGFGSAPAVAGDPSRTFYISKPTDTPGQTIPISGYNSSALGSGGTNLSGMENMILGLTTELDGAAILSQSSQPVEWAVGWTSLNTSANSFGVFTNIQQSFGGEGDFAYVDIQRILATTTGANPGGTAGGGTWVGTIGIGSDGTITVISAIPEPSTSLLAAAATGLLAFRRRRPLMA